MSTMAAKLPRMARLLALALVLALVAVLVYLLSGGGTKHGTAYFPEVKNVYPGDAIRLLGLPVGKITSITPAGDQVKVDFDYDSTYSLPADVHAAIMSPTLVATRYIQLAPAYTGGPTFADGGVIPAARTAAPVEFDELKDQISQLDEALGPDGANRNGALNRALTVIDTNGRGQGQNFHDMIVQLSAAARTLSDGRGDLFGTVRNLAAFSSALNGVDGDITHFNTQLSDVSKVLDDNDEQLRTLLPQVDEAADSVNRFLDDHGGQLTHTVSDAAAVSRALAQERDNIAETLRLAGNTVGNLTNVWGPRSLELNGMLTVDQLSKEGSPGSTICAAMAESASPDVKKGTDACAQYLGPLLKYLRQQPPPIGLNTLEVPGDGHAPRNGDPVEPGLPGGPTVDGTAPGDSQLPRYGQSTTENGAPDHQPHGGSQPAPCGTRCGGGSQNYTDPPASGSSDDPGDGGLLGLMKGGH
jgi:phospholipid/cholesterol/gamma-HCH transport system substrate-binding protein